MIIQIKTETEFEVIIVDGVEYKIPRQPNRSLSVRDVADYFDEKAPNISKAVQDAYFQHLWGGGSRTRKGNPNPWGHNGGRRWAR